MAELIARGQTVHFGSIGAASLDIVPLLALEMLGLDVAVLLGLNSRNAARAGLVGGEFDVDYQTSPGYLAQVRPLAEVGQVVPLMSLGAMDRHGRLARDPAFPALPSFPRSIARSTAATPRALNGRHGRRCSVPVSPRRRWSSCPAACPMRAPMCFAPPLPRWPPIQASWITATSACSEVFRASRKPGKQLPCRSFGTRRFSVPPGGPLAAAFMPTGADDAFHIGLHDQLQHRLGDAAQKVALIVLGQKLGQVHVRPGHRGLRMVRG